MTKEIELRLQGYRLTTAEITYRLPDHPDLLQVFVWQALDLAPRYPVLGRFLEFWRANLDGKLYSVRVGQSRVFHEAEIRSVSSLQVLH